MVFGIERAPEATADFEADQISLNQTAPARAASFTQRECGTDANAGAQSFFDYRDYSIGFRCCADPTGKR